MAELVIEIKYRRLTNLKDFKEMFGKLKDGKHLVSVKTITKRSLRQNAYYWGVVVPMVREGLFDNGYDEVTENDEAHEILKHVHLKKQMISKQHGEVLEIAGSSAKLSIPEFNDYIERICRWSAEYLGVVIPSPNEPLIMLAEYNEELNATIVEEQ